MDFALTEEQEAFRKMVKEWVARECPPDKALELEAQEFEYPEELYQKMAASRLPRRGHRRGVRRVRRHRDGPGHPDPRAVALAGRHRLDLGHQLLRRGEVGGVLRQRRAEEAVPPGDRVRREEVRDRRDRARRRHRHPRCDDDDRAARSTAAGCSTARRSGRPRPTSSDYLLTLARSDKNVEKKTQGTTLFLVPGDAKGLHQPADPQAGHEVRRQLRGLPTTTSSCPTSSCSASPGVPGTCCSRR